jgi:hypothetical protein
MAAEFILITGAEEVTSGAFPEMETAGPGYIAEPHRIWIFFCTPALFS